jgi:GSH-dependent disulfide-bond oxidoreductase
MFTVLGSGSPNVRKVLLMLEELDLPYETRSVSLFEGEQFTPEFRAISPFSKVPVLLQTDGAGGERALCESGAILIHLAERYGRFLEKSGPLRDAALQWLMIQMANVGPALGQYNHFKLVDEAGKDYGRERFRALAERTYRLLDDRCAESPYLAGDAYSIADIATYPWALYLELHRMDPAAHPNLVRWRDGIGARPAAARAAVRMDVLSGKNRELMRKATKAQLDQFFWRGGQP